MTVYKIDCEWDVGFKELYPSREAAEKAIDETDWKGMGLLEDDEKYEDLIKEGLLSIKPVEV